MASGPITVVGLDGSPLGERACARLAAAELVVGGPRQLRLAPAGAAARRLELGGDLEPALAAIAAATGPVVVLASGDPGFFGIVRALAARFGRAALEVLPALSSVATAFAHAGLPWDDAVVASAHGRDPRPALAACLAHAKVAVLTGPGFGPAELGAALAGTQRRLLVAERLGEPAERVTEGTPEEIARGRWTDPNVVLVLDETASVAEGKAAAWPARQTPTRWALGEEAFTYRGGMVTKAEVRALALARLGPGLGDLIWDVGAGSGSVAVECARLGAAVVAVDADLAACELVAANAARHGVRVRVVHGTAPQALAGLPDPDGVFVGGGGAQLAAVCEVAATRARRAVVVALASLERVAPTAALLAGHGLEVDMVLVQAARLRALSTLHRLDPINPVFLITGVRAP